MARIKNPASTSEFVENRSSLTAGGSPLDPPTQHRFETQFNTRLDHVRVHVGQNVAALGALAYSRGDNVYFAPGAYDPHSPAGNELLGHELAHVVQQRGGRVALENADKDKEKEKDEDKETFASPAPSATPASTAARFS